MRVKIGPYRNRWTCQVHYDYMNKKYDRRWEESTTRFESILEKVEDSLQWVYNHTINLIIDRRSGQKIKVRIDKYDTWSMDHTLAPIILPMLKQLKETKHGAPWVDIEDVPEKLRATKEQIDAYSKDGDVDPKHFERWDWILDEMIWAFEQKCRDDWESDYYEYREPGPEEEKDPNSLFGLKLVWEDRKGQKAHQERMSNGFRLFGKYYENLWD